MLRMRSDLLQIVQRYIPKKLSRSPSKLSVKQREASLDLDEGLVKAFKARRNPGGYHTLALRKLEHIDGGDVFVIFAVNDKREFRIFDGRLLKEAEKNAWRYIRTHASS